MAVCMMAISLFAVITLALEIGYVTTSEDHESYYNFAEPKVNHDPVWNQADQPNALLRMNNFKFVYEADRSTCHVVTPEAPMLLLVLVTSKAADINKRSVIRETWGSLLNYQRWNVRVVFLLSEEEETSTALDNIILSEASENGDIIMGNIEVGIKQEVQTILMGYKWALSYCRTADYILQTSDNIYVDLFRVIERILYMKPNMTALCHVNWAEQVNRYNTEVERYVSEEEFKKDVFPSHCTPTVNIMTYDLVEYIYSASHKVQFIHLQDVFFTGIIRHAKPFNLLDIGFEYQYNQYSALAWARNGHYGKDQKLPWMFIIITNSDNYKKDFQDLWKKITTVYKQVYKFEVSRK